MYLSTQNKHYPIQKSILEKKKKKKECKVALLVTNFTLPCTAATAQDSFLIFVMYMNSCNHGHQRNGYYLGTLNTLPFLRKRLQTHKASKL